jgi:hypothetical protein
MDKNGQAYILAMLSILFAVIVALLYSPTLSYNVPPSDKNELMQRMMFGFLRSEVASRTASAFEAFEAHLGSHEKWISEVLEGKLKSNFLLGSNGLCVQVMKDVYMLSDITLEVSEANYPEFKFDKVGDVDLVNLTSFELELYYSYNDPIYGRVGPVKTSYIVEVRDLEVSELKTVEDTILYRVDISFKLACTAGSEKTIKYSLWIFDGSSLEKITEGYFEEGRESESHTFSVLIRPEYHIMLSEGRELRFIIRLCASRGETLWVVAKVRKG